MPVKLLPPPLELQILLKLKCEYFCLSVHDWTLDGPLIINGINTLIATVGVGQITISGPRGSFVSVRVTT